MKTKKLYPQGEINTILYKYFRIDNNFRNTILKNYLWFSAPTEFNDPYDCNLSFDNDVTENELRYFYNKSREINNKLGNSSYNGIDIESKINEYKNNPKEFIKGINQSIRDTINSYYGFCCFSQDFDNLLMWAHYTNKHEGICLVFDIEKDTSLFGDLILKMDYPGDYPQINYLKERYNGNWGFKSVQFIFGTKSKDWSYENEVRVFRTKGDHTIFQGAVSFNKSALIEVIFGNNASLETIKELIDLFKTCDYKVDFYKMKLKDRKFGLEKEKIHVG